MPKKIRKIRPKKVNPYRQQKRVQQKKHSKKFLQGTFEPKNPQKYVGKSKPIYRSSWELSFMVMCDTHKNILEWVSEPFKIPYTHPFQDRVRNYIPDFLIMYVAKDGTVKTEIIEIKPKSQTSLQEAGNSQYNKEQVTINEAKWKSATAFCKRVGLTFRVMSEKEMFHTGTRK